MMCRIRFAALTVALLGTLASSRAADDAKDDTQKLQGTWRLVALETNGEKASKDDLKREQKMVVEKDSFSSTGSDRHNFKGTFRLDSTKKPHTVDMTVSEGEFKGKTLHGIYELDGDTMRAAYAQPGKDRPSDFSGKPGVSVYTYQRAKR